MSYLLNNQQKINDIIFANRNKAYGAYQIRSAYTTTVARSIFIMVSTVGVFFGTAFYLTREKISILKIEPYTLDSALLKITPFNLPEPTPPEQKSNPNPTPTRNDPAPENSIVTINDTVQTEAVLSTSASISSTATTETGPGDGTLSFNGNGGNKQPGTGEETVNDDYQVDTPPEFEGGINALYKFLQTQLRYPPVAFEEGVEGVVHVKFVVDENGKVGSLVLLNNPGYGLDAEALRVVSRIPDFKKPATVKGKPVKVYYRLPIRFKIK